MNTYERLIYLATRVEEKNIFLCNENGTKLSSSTEVFNQLMKELSSEFYNSQVIDMRQACETRVIDN